ncbi:MAG: sugar transferase [Candidatus Omnitrophica bacterium]|nr:sugar transferase [Candidatus Omnitrophota bacterium]
MLKERYKLVQRGLICVDAIVLSFAFLCAYYVRLHFHDFYSLDLIFNEVVVTDPVAFNRYVPVSFLGVGIWCWMLVVNGMYRSFRTSSFPDVVWDIVQATFFSAGFFGAVTFFLKIEFVSRFFFVIFMGLGVVFLIIEKWGIMMMSRYFRKKGFNYRRILVVGTGQRVKRFVGLTKDHPEWGVRIMGLIDDEETKMAKEFFGIKVVGLLKDMPRILRENVIDEVMFIVPRRWLERIQKTITVCELQGVKASVAADLFNLKIARASQTDFCGFPLLTFETIPAKEWHLFVKRSIDLLVSTAGIIFLFPVFLVIAVFIKLTSRGPVFFRQKRVSFHGRIFTLYKFRSMHKDASERLSEVRHLNEMDGPVFKIKNDPRITSLGRFLRKTSIDEFPQLFNVFKGDMSLVGPRPPMVDEVEEYEMRHIRRLSMRSGITCLWQIGGRNQTDFEEWMELDLEYIDNWSLWLDIKILVMTIPAVLLGSGH